MARVGEREIQGFGRETWRKRTARNIFELTVTWKRVQKKTELFK